MDKLEQELGLDELDNPFGWNSSHITSSSSSATGNEQTWSSVPPDTPFSNSKTLKTKIIADNSLRIISGMFIGCIPLDLSASVMDWAILTGEHYAGFNFFYIILFYFHFHLLLFIFIYFHLFYLFLLIYSVVVFVFKKH